MKKWEYYIKLMISQKKQENRPQNKQNELL